MLIRDNIYAVLGLAHPIGVNAGFVVSSHGVIVIDCGLTLNSALTIYSYIKAVSGDVPIKYLVYTEHHSDHIFGAKVFKEHGAKIISHTKTKEFLLTEGKDYVSFIVNRENSYETRQKFIAMGYDFGRSFVGDVKVILPDILLEKETKMNCGDTEFIIIPTPGHLDGCLSIYFPKAKVLFAGDTIYAGFPPTTQFGNIELWEKWVGSLNYLMTFDIETIIPGHGYLCGKEEIKKNLDYIERFTAQSHSPNTY
ncbi:MAG: MBL fold metallo-hydrolase [Candidatus Edwardsbacteria bacterium]